MKMKEENSLSEISPEELGEKEKAVLEEKINKLLIRYMTNNSNDWSADVLEKILLKTVKAIEEGGQTQPGERRQLWRWAKEGSNIKGKSSQEQEIIHWYKQHGIGLMEGTQKDVRRVMEEGHVNAGYKFVANEAKGFVVFGKHPKNLYMIEYKEFYQAICKNILGIAKKMNDNLEECNEIYDKVIERQGKMTEMIKEQLQQLNSFAQYIKQQKSSESEHFSMKK
jgi:hypothetical protein